MAGGYSAPEPGELSALFAELKSLRSRVSELERPTGTQNLRSVALLEQLRTYTSRSGIANQVGPGVTNYSGLPAIAFETDRPMTVLVQVAAPYQASFPNAVTAEVNISYTLDGALGPILTSVYERTTTGATSTDITRTAFGSAVGTVGPGAHLLQAASGYVSLGGGAPGIDFINGQQVQIVLSVLGEDSIISLP